MNKLTIRHTSQTLQFIACIIVMITSVTLQAQTIKTFDSFDYNDGTQIAGQSGGWGWMGSWTASDAAAAATYTASSTIPFTYANPATSSYYVTPGMMQGSNTENKIIGRYLNTNTSTGSPYSTWIDATGSIAMTVSTPMYIGFLIRKDVLDDKQIAFGISDGLSTENINNGVSIGYFGPIKSVSNGVRYWTLKYYNGTEYVYYITNKPIVAGKNEFFVICPAAVNATGNFSFLYSPIIQNAVSATSVYTGFTIPSLKFRSVFYFSEGNGSIDEIRITPSFNVALMYGPTQGMTGVNDPGTGVPGAPVLTSETNRWKLDGNNEINTAYHFIGTTDAQDLKVRTNNVERMTVTKDGNVGIGITTPAEKLDIVGNIVADGIALSRNNTNRGALWFANQGDYNHVIYNNGEDRDSEGTWDGLKINVYEGLNVRVRGEDNASSTVSALYVNHAGKVGIGTITPLVPLDIIQDANVLLKIRSTKGGDNNTAAIDFSTFNNPPIDGANARIAAVDMTSWNGSLAFYTDGDSEMNSNPTERMRITHEGKVGIGTITPLTPLDIVQDANVLLKIRSTKGGDNNTAAIDFSTFNNPPIDGANARIAAVDMASWNGSLAFYTDGDSEMNSNPTERMRITHEGKVGIGTTTPSEKLEVAGNVKVNGIIFPDGTQLTTAGASSSSSNLTIAPYSSTDNNGYVSANGVGTGLIFETPDAGTSIGIPRMSITNSGNIGIGTTNPTAALHVIGDIYISKKDAPAYTSGYSSKLKFDDGDMENTDPLWIARYNTAEDQSELRINIGNDPSGTNAMDKLVIGNTSSDGTTWTPVLTVNSNGEINTSSHIRIGGKVLSQDVKVVTNPLSAAFPDYVFKKGYKLATLTGIETYIKENGHLPEVPSAEEVQAEGGFELGKMNILLLKKVEELTLHLIQQEKKNIDLEKRIKQLEKQK